MSWYVLCLLYVNFKLAGNKTKQCKKKWNVTNLHKKKNYKFTRNEMKPCTNENRKEYCPIAC